jgi:predicted nucleic acid-binding protein
VAKAGADPFLAPGLVLTAGPVLYLAELGYLRRLALLNQIAVPESVLRQVGRGRPELVGRLRTTPRLVLAEPQPSFADRARQAGISDEGTAAAIGLALESHGVAVLDDAAGQRAASSLGLPLVNSLGLIDALHDVGLAVRTLRQDLRLMGECGFALSPRIQAAMSSGSAEWLRLELADEALALDWLRPTFRPKGTPASAGAELEELER